jgi:hypothetical protein
MDKPHKQVITTYPVAIKKGQGRLHVIPYGTWHRREESLKCPECETSFVLTDGFPKDQVLAVLKKQHENQEEHPDYIPSAPEWQHVEDCDCNMPKIVPSPQKV